MVDDVSFGLLKVVLNIRWVGMGYNLDANPLQRRLPVKRVGWLAAAQHPQGPVRSDVASYACQENVGVFCQTSRYAYVVYCNIHHTHVLLALFQSEVGEQTWKNIADRKPDHNSGNGASDW